MCRPNQLDAVRLKKTITDVQARSGSSTGLGGHRRHVVYAGAHGIAKGPDKNKPDHFLVMFDHEDNKTLVASICHLDMKGVEQHV